MDIVGLGELLIDFAPVEMRVFQANAGGAPCNALTAAARQGCKAGFIGMVGNDDFGTMLELDIQEAGIDTQGLVKTNKANTTLAFVQLDGQGERSFTFVRKPGADTLLSTDDINFDLIQSSKIFHFGSLSLTNEPARGATIAAAKFAREKGILVSYDPNLRPALWADLNEAKEMILLGMQYADIAKISEEEMEFLTARTDLEQGANILLEQNPNLQVLLITLGSKGCYYQTRAYHGHTISYVVQVVDTTGAGDGFFGGVLATLVRLEELDVSKISQEALIDCVTHGNASGALATTKKGGIPSMPTLAEVENCMATFEKQTL